jgi:TRAP-type C4-dicarboxylate transport system substrate-binding protein
MLPLAAAALLAAGAARAIDPPVIKMASVAPKGSIYHRVLQEIGEAYRVSRGGQGRVIVYTDSVQGTESDTVRRMRVGQLDASMLTIVGLSEIDPSVAALQFMPMMFRSWEEVDHVREQLRPILEEKLAAKGFSVLFWGEVGWVQFFSKDRIATPEEFKRARIFVWAGDSAQVGLMKSLGYQPVPLQITDIVPGLETGMIDAVPVAPMWSLVGQFDRVARHMLPVKWVPIVGATVMRRTTLEGLSPTSREALLKAAQGAGEKLRTHRTSQDEEAIRAMRDRGLVVQPLTPELERAWLDVAERSWPLVRGSLVPAETFDRVQQILAEFRSGGK